MPWGQFTPAECDIATFFPEAAGSENRDILDGRQPTCPPGSVTVITYADDRFKRKASTGGYIATQVRVEKVLRAHPEVCSVRSLNASHLLPTRFFACNQAALDKSLTRAAGNMWKPYFLLKQLWASAPNEYVLYHDTSPEVWNFKINFSNLSLAPHLQACDDNKGLLLGGGRWTMSKQRDFSSPSCMIRMHASFLGGKFQDCTSWVLAKNTAEVRKIVAEILYFNVLPVCASYDEFKIFDKKLDANFVEHRGDQSVISLHMLSNGMKKTMPTRTKNVFSYYGCPGTESQQCSDNACRNKCWLPQPGPQPFGD